LPHCVVPHYVVPHCVVPHYVLPHCVVPHYVISSFFLLLPLSYFQEIIFKYRQFIKIQFYLYVKPFTLVSSYKSLGGLGCLHLQTSPRKLSMDCQENEGCRLLRNVGNLSPA
jgi:hypothetical protein